MICYICLKSPTLLILGFPGGVRCQQLLHQSRLSDRTQEHNEGKVQILRAFGMIPDVLHEAILKVARLKLLLCPIWGFLCLSGSNQCFHLELLECSQFFMLQMLCADTFGPFKKRAVAQICCQAEVPPWSSGAQTKFGAQLPFCLVPGSPPAAADCTALFRYSKH